jgi:hypothetical protein
MKYLKKPYLFLILASLFPLAHAQSYSAKLGKTYNVFSYPKDSCMVKYKNEWGDRADMAARAFIDHEGNIQLYSGYFDMFRMTGKSLDSLKRVCGTNGNGAVMYSAHDSNYFNHRSREWLQAFYTKNGKDVAAVASVDWNGWWYSNHPTCKDLKNAGNIKCWWNKLTAFRSKDGGKTFTPSTGSKPNKPLAHPPGNPHVNPANSDRTGFFSVSNILKDPKSGHYFFYTTVKGVGAQKNGVCLFRAWNGSDLSNPNSWHSYSQEGVTHPSRTQACNPIRMPKGQGGTRFIGYSTYYEKYILISGGTDKEGFYFALSDSLIDWPQNETYFVPFYKGHTLYYMSLIDPNYSNEVKKIKESEAARKERRNFDVVGQKPWLFFVQKTASGYPILKRVELTFQGK